MMREGEGDEARPLLGDSAATGISAWRFWALFVFTMMTTVQNVGWICFSTVVVEAKEYYHIDDAEVQRLLEVGTLVFIPATLLFSPLTRQFGLRAAVILSAGCVAAGGVCRWVGGRSYTWLFVGQTLNGLAGATICNAPVQLASQWFPLEERATATGVAWSAQSIGVALAFIGAPAIAPNPDDIADLMRYLAYCDIGLLVLSLTYPQPPLLPPTMSAAAPRQSNLGGVQSLCRNGDFLRLLFVYGAGCGACVSVSTFIDIFMQNTASGRTIGQIGFVGNIVGLVTGIALPALLVDACGQQRNMKSVLVVLYVLMSATAAIFGWTVCWLGDDNLSAWVVAIPYIFFVMLYGAVSPLVFEFAAELCFPVAEETAAAALNMIYVVLNVSANEIFNHISTKFALFGTAVLLSACTIAALPIKKGVKRLSLDTEKDVSLN